MTLIWLYDRPEDLAGPRPPGFDGFFSLIAFDELSNCGSGGVVWGSVAV